MNMVIQPLQLGRACVPPVSSQEHINEKDAGD